MKIGISIWTFTPNTGGLQSHAENLCQHLRQRGHDVRVITRSATRVPFFSDYLYSNEPDDGIQVGGTPVRFIRFSRAWFPILWLILKTAARPLTQGLAARLYQLVAKAPSRKVFAGFDLIHHVGHATALVGFAAAQSAKFHKIPFLVQPTAHPAHFGDKPLDLKLYGQADRLLVHTGYERDYFAAKGVVCPVDIVYNGIEDRADGQGGRFRAKYNLNGPIILFLGRKSADKGFPLAIAAFKLIQKEYLDATLVCIGPKEAPGISETTRGILELDYVSEAEKHDALAACTCLCVPSTGESFGLVYMEAGRYGKPSIGRNVPALRELLGKNNAALLVGRPNDQTNSAELTAEELAAGLKQLLESPGLCRDIGDACLQVSSKYLWPQVVQRFEAAYYASLKPSQIVSVS